METIAERMGVPVARVVEIENIPSGALGDNLETIRNYLAAVGLGPAPRSAVREARPFDAAQLATLAFLGLLDEATPGVFCPSSGLRFVFGKRPNAMRLRLVVPLSEEGGQA